MLCLVIGELPPTLQELMGCGAQHSAGGVLTLRGEQNASMRVSSYAVPSRVSMPCIRARRWGDLTRLCTPKGGWTRGNLTLPGVCIYCRWVRRRRTMRIPPIPIPQSPRTLHGRNRRRCTVSRRAACPAPCLRIRAAGSVSGVELSARILPGAQKARRRDNRCGLVRPGCDRAVENAGPAGASGVDGADGLHWTKRIAREAGS